MLAWLRNLVRPFPKASFTHRGVRFLRGRYDAAVTTGDNRRHWKNADGLSANAANSPEVRRTLRNRSRYEIANNSYAKGVVLTLANDVIGTGPRLQLLTEDSEANRRIESEFMRWAKACGLAEKLRTLRMACAADGEAFAVLINNERLPTDIKLDLRLIEADQVTTPFTANASRREAVDGIVFDNAANPVEYHVLREHPGSSLSFPGEFDRIPADAMLHLLRADVPASVAAFRKSRRRCRCSPCCGIIRWQLSMLPRRQRISPEFCTPTRRLGAKRTPLNRSMRLNSTAICC